MEQLYIRKAMPFYQACKQVEATSMKNQVKASVNEVGNVNNFSADPGWRETYLTIICAIPNATKLEIIKLLPLHRVVKC
jgi:hypothetical protein